MAILPWVNLPENRTPELLGSIGDTLIAAAKRKQEQERAAADLLLRQRSADREDRLATGQLANYASEAEARKSEAAMRAAQEKRITDQANRQQGLDIAGAIPKIRSMLTPGSPDYDPQSAMSLARAHGINLTAQQPQAPVQPNIGPTQLEYGPRETPEIAQQAGEERARLAEMRGNFDRNSQYARGGEYSTKLNPLEEAAFRQWVQTSKAPFDPNQPTQDYDMRGYWKDIASKGGNATQLNPNDGEMHFPDTYKTPFHQSFSAESRYAMPTAPKWANDHQLVGSDGKVVFDETAPRAPGGTDYAAQAEAERQRFAQANDPDAVARNQLQAANYRDQVEKYRTAQPTYSGTSPIGPVNIDPNAALEARRFAAAEQKRALAPLMNVPGFEKYAPQINGMIDAGASRAEVEAAIKQASADLEKEQEKSKYELTADEKMRHNRAMEAAAFANAGARGTAAANSTDTATDRDLTMYLAQVKEFEANAGVKQDVAMMKNIGKIHEELHSQPASPIAQNAAIDTIAQIAQGGKASMGVMNVINKHALGPVETAYDKTYQLTHNGAHSPMWVKSMSDTLEGLKAYAGQEQQRVMQGFEAAAGDQSLFNGPEFSKARDSQRRKLQASLGMDIAPERPAEPGALQPGTGKRPTVGEQLVSAARKPPARNPLTDAAKPKASIDDLLKQAGY
jgi:hypothetical protein